jgi:hypothetical protein
VAYNWTKLFDLLMSLKSSGPFQFRFLNHETALINALMSGTIPLRGKKDYQFEFCRIDPLLSVESNISLYLNCVTTYTRTPSLLSSGTSFLNQTTFKDVEADMNGVETWLLDNAIENDRVLPTGLARHPSKAAIQDLERYLSEQPNEPVPIKKEVFEDLKAGNVQKLGNRYQSLSFREFSRAWTKSAPAPWTKAGVRPRRSRKI